MLLRECAPNDPLTKLKLDVSPKSRPWSTFLITVFCLNLHSWDYNPFTFKINSRVFCPLLSRNRIETLRKVTFLNVILSMCPYIIFAWANPDLFFHCSLLWEFSQYLLWFHHVLFNFFSYVTVVFLQRLCLGQAWIRVTLPFLLI